MRLAVMGVMALALACGTSGGEGLSATPSGRTFSAADFVTATRYTKVFVEVDTEMKPPEAAPLEMFMAELDLTRKRGGLDKPGGFVWKADELLKPDDPQHRWTLDEIKDYVSAHRSLEPEKDAAGVYLLYLAGTWHADTEDSYVLGLSFGGSVIVVFAPNLLKACTTHLAGMSVDAINVTETALLMHEFGHLMGLVNNGTAMVTAHQDEEHGKHDVDESCLMHWESDRPKLAKTVGDQFKNNLRSVPKFCSKCIDDLKAMISSP